MKERERRLEERQRSARRRAGLEWSVSFEEERMKRGKYEEERLREERERERRVLEAQEWSEEGDNDEWKFDQESTLVNMVEEFESQATRRTNETTHAPERSLVWWRN